MKRTKKPDDDDAMELLNNLGYDFAEKHIVTANLKEELAKLRKNRKAGDEWSEECICILGEEVVCDFVDQDGNITDHLGYSQDDVGRYRVSFFLKSVDFKKAKAKFCLATPVTSDAEFEEHTVSDMDEVKDELRAVSNRMQATLAYQTESIRQEFKSDLREMMMQFAKIMNSPEPSKPTAETRDSQPASKYQRKVATGTAHDCICWANDLLES